ncbi:unnamed protein product [Calicophoron daubneyi]|uniref:C2H2-type domain-containing protein n=1 Tax=Calicophoron daubneyi TaxID=300641 RepID=A0AAV2TTC9_CALDB
MEAVKSDPDKRGFRLLAPKLPLGREQAPDDLASVSSLVSHFAQGLRPLLPKTNRRKSPLPRTRSPPTQTRKHIAPKHDPKNSVLISFAAYDQCVPCISQSRRFRRVAYANSLMSQKNITVPSNRGLRMYNILPRSRLVNDASHPEVPDTNSDVTASMTASSSLNPVDTTVQDLSDGGASSSSDFTSDSSVQNTASDFHAKTHEFVRRLPLRPSCELLVRVGRGLVRSQYERMKDRSCVAEGNSGDEAESPVPKRKRSENGKTSDQRASPDESLLSAPVVSHLEWRKKEIVQRWCHVRAMCSTRMCPYTATSIFALHRHLEQGHQRMVSCLDEMKLSVVTPKYQGGKSTRCRIPSFKPSKVRLDDHFLVPVVTDVTQSVSPTPSCPVCNHCDYSWMVIMKHMNRVHPFVSFGPIQKPVYINCAVCGQCIRIDTTLNIPSRLNTAEHGLMHPACFPKPDSHRNASWAAYDAHALTCLMLFPNIRSRILVPVILADLLYRSLDRMLSPSEIWRTEDLALRCSLAVSSLYGELVEGVTGDVSVENLKPPNSVTRSQPEQAIKNICKPTKSRMDLVDALQPCTQSIPKAPQGEELRENRKRLIQPFNPSCSKSATTTTHSVPPVIAPKMNFRLILPPANSTNLNPGKFVLAPSSALRTPQTILPAVVTPSVVIPPNPQMVSQNALFSIQQNILPQTHPPALQVISSQSLSSIGRTDIELPRSPPVALSTTASVPISRSPAKSVVSIDLTRDHTSYTSPPKTIVTENPSSSLDSKRDALQAHRLSGKMKRSNPVISSMCVLCELHVPTAPLERRRHLVTVHRVQLGAAPTFHCLHCGQLFWTSEECTCHQVVSCESCSSFNICKSTYYLHWVLCHQLNLFKLLRDRPLSCKLCDFKCTSIQIFTTHLREQHYSVIPLDLLRKFGQLYFTPLELDSCPFVRSTELIPLYTMTTNKRKPLANVRALPPPIVSYDPDDLRRQIFMCSVCNAQFISVTYCDLHMVQAGHQYFCPLCPYSSDRAATLCAHHTSVHLNEIQGASGPSEKGFKIFRVDSFDINKVSKTVIPLPNSVSSPSLPPSSNPPADANILHTVAPMSQFHACDKCPVFCLTMEDLDTHRQTAHSCSPISTTVVRSSNSTPPVCASDHSQQTKGIIENTATSIQSNPRPGDTTPSRSVVVSCPAVADTLITSRSVNEVTVPRNPRDQLLSSPIKIKTEPIEDEFFCPLCEFRSTTRSEIMQHVVDAH